MIVDITDNLKVIKRDSKKVSFDGKKIVLAIKKGFDSVKDSFTKNQLHNEEDVNKVYLSVIDRINDEYKDKREIKIESIQDMIEEELLKLGYKDIYERFSEYRNIRSKSRKKFTTSQNRIIKNYEKLGLALAHNNDIKRENGNIDGNGAMGTMLQFGGSITKEFAKAYIISDEYAKLHDEGFIHIHDLDFYITGTTTCNQINLKKLFDKGFNTGHGFLRTPNSIASYSALAAIAIQANQNDQHGGQSIPAFDYYLAPGVIKTFKKELKQLIYDFFDITNELEHLDMDKIIEKVDSINSIDFEISIIDNLVDEKYRYLIKKAYDKAVKKTDRHTFQAMEAFIHNLNTMHSRAGAQVPFSSINFGTDTSVEGRMVIKNYLLALEKGLGKGETPIFPISIFKVKEGINYNPEDPNYDLFKLSCKVSAKRLFPNFSFIDAPFNKQYYKEGSVDTEVAYMGCRTRVIGNTYDKTNEIVTGRGNLSFTTINLVRLGIENGIVKKENGIKGFYSDLDELMDKVVLQLIERFKFQCTKTAINFPFLLKQGVWLNSDKLREFDDITEVLKQGTISIGFIGLAECLKALVGKHHGEDEETYKLSVDIIKHMREKCDYYSEKYDMNVTLLATPAEGLSGRFTNIDKSIYGKIEGITDRDYYTNSFHIPVHYNINSLDKINKEAKFHEFTNAGHITYIELDGDTVNNVDAFEKVVRMMREANIGYGAINHPVDRDPICGYSGVINDICPGCNRTEDDGIKFERIRRITGYLTGTLDRFNDAKRAEEKNRVKHGVKNED